MKVKSECGGADSSGSTSDDVKQKVVEEEKMELEEEDEEGEEDKYEPDLDLEADFPQGKLLQLTDPSPATVPGPQEESGTVFGIDFQGYTQHVPTLIK